MNTTLHHGDETKCPDFSRLPDNIWQKIFSMLDMEERYQVSSTSPRLSSMLAVASLWRTGIVTLTRPPQGIDARLYPQQDTFVQKFGTFFQHLTLFVPNVLFDEDTFRTLMNLSSGMELKSLTLRLTCSSNVSLTKKGLEARTSLFSVLKAWNFSKLTFLRVDFPNALFQLTPDLTAIHNKVYELLRSEESFSQVQEVVIRGSVTEYYIHGIISQWPLCPTACAVSSFRQLQHLNITVINLSDDLLQVLADLSESHHHFRLLSIHMCFFQHALLPQLSPSAWRQLIVVCPHLQVDCHLTTALTDSCLEHVILPEVPLCRVTVEGRPSHNQIFQKMIQMCSHHPDTLQALLCFGNPSGEPSNMTSLVTMVTNCPHVTELVFHGTIHIDDLTRLASLDRAWRRFEVRGKGVVMGDGTVPDSASNSGHSPEQPQEDCRSPEEVDSKLADVCELLSERLGFQWSPL